MLYTDNRQNKIEVNRKFTDKLSEVCTFTLMEEGIDIDCQISLVFVDNEEIKKINEETRGIKKETDVLSFPMIDYEEDKVYKNMYIGYEFDETYMDGKELVLGDMVLSLEKALEQSIEYNHSYEREVCYLIVHSILHLLGYDHMEDGEKMKMRNREEEILNKLNIIRE